MKKLIVGFLMGGGVGGAIGWFFTRRHYLKKFPEYLENECKGCKNRARTEVVEKEPVVDVKEEVFGVDLGPQPDVKAEVEDPVVKKAYEGIEFITEDEFGMKDDYDQHFLIFYADKVLCHDTEEKPVVSHEIRDWHLPPYWMDKIIEAEDGLIFCRDNIHKEDFQIVRTEWNYNEQIFPKGDRSVHLGNMEDLEDE